MPLPAPASGSANPSLSQAQFGGTPPAQAQQATAPNPTASFMAPPAIPGPPQPLGQQQHPPHTLAEGGGGGPMPGMASSYGSVKTASAWRTPQGRVMPLGKATFGSTFQPFD